MIIQQVTQLIAERESEDVLIVERPLNPTRIWVWYVDFISAGKDQIEFVLIDVVDGQSKWLGKFEVEASHDSASMKSI